LILAYGFAALLRGLKGTPQYRFFLMTALLFALIGVTFGIIGLLGTRKHGRKGILIPALVGSVLNSVLVLAAFLGVLKGLNDGPQQPEAAATVSSSPQPVDPGQVSRKAPAQRLPKADKPIVRLLDPGAEPRTVLRLEPKVGDRQLVALTMKLRMDPGPFTNLPPVVMTTRITIKHVSPNGDIRYERVITDVNVPDGSGPAAPDMKLLKTDFSRLKGLTTSGVMSSRGLSISERTQTKSSKPGEALPAIVRLFRMQMEEALNIIAAPLPLEAIGAGAKWEVTPAAGSRDEVVKAVYEVVSIERNRVTTKITVTASASKQKSKDFAMTGTGSGEMTMDLARLMPAEGNLVYGMEASESDPAGGPKGKITMKMRMDLRIEAK